MLLAFKVEKIILILRLLECKMPAQLKEHPLLDCYWTVQTEQQAHLCKFDLPKLLYWKKDKCLF